MMIAFTIAPEHNAVLESSLVFPFGSLRNGVSDYELALR